MANFRLHLMPPHMKKMKIRLRSCGFFIDLENRVFQQNKVYSGYSVPNLSDGVCLIRWWPIQQVTLRCSMYAQIVSCPAKFCGKSGAFWLCIKDFNVLGRRGLAMITAGIKQDFPCSVRAQSPGRVERSPNVLGLPRVSNCRHAIRPAADCERAVGNDLYDCRTPAYQLSVRCKEAGPSPAYLRNFDRGLASGPINFSEYGIQLSRSFKALRAWMGLKTEGVERYGQQIEQNIRQARYLTSLIENEPDLELLAPTAMNIVNFRFIANGFDDERLNDLNAEILMLLQERGIAAPSSTELGGRFSIRVAICNHRSRRSDFEALVNAVKEIGQELLAMRLNTS